MLAWIAHPLPVVWAIGTAAYVTVASRIQSPRRPLLLLVGLVTLGTARYILIHRYAYSWSLDQITFINGANQVTLFGMKYMLPFTGLVLIWAMLLLRLIKRHGLAHLFSTIPFQVWILNATAVLLMPDRLLFPQFGQPLGFIAERLSLAAGLVMCAALAAAPTARLARIALISVAILFFGFLYSDDRDLNRFEDRMDLGVSRLPPGQRVVSSLPDNSLRSLCLHHDLDRACIGHCYSYANYEPPSRQFRIRARPANGIVLDDADFDAVVRGTYRVQTHDLPLYLVYPCGSDFQDVCSRPLQVGETIGKPN
jgi:hypothetical protein